MEPRRVGSGMAVAGTLVAMATLGCVPGDGGTGGGTTTLMPTSTWASTSTTIGTTTTTTTTPPAASGSAFAWGYNGFGNLGDATLSDRPAPVSMQLPTGVELTAISAGGFQTVGLGSDGVAYAVGRDDFGQLGNDAALAYSVTPVPVAMPAGVRFVQVASGGYHTLAIGDDGNTYAWGWDVDGQLGDDAALVQQPVPVRVAMPPGVHFISVSAGFSHSLAVGDDGFAYAWGYDFYSELGNDSVHLNRPTPVRVAMPGGVSVVQVSAGGHHSLAIGDDGNTYAWGWDAYGQLGDDPGSTSRDMPVPVHRPAGATFTAVSAGAHHSLAIATDGSVYGWGSDENGQLGDGAPTADQALPVAVAGAFQAIRVSGGGRHSMAIGTDGVVYTWGADGAGQVGDGAPADDRPIPTAVALDGGHAIAVGAGYYHSVAVAQGN